MASPLYSKVHAVVSKYLDDQQASAILARQLTRCGATDADFSREHLAKVRPTLTGAVQLYLTDKAKCYAVADEILALG